MIIRLLTFKLYWYKTNILLLSNIDLIL